MKNRNVMTKTKCMMILLLIFSINQAGAAPCGDVNSSGAIDIVDALVIAQHYVGLSPANFDAAAADVNGNGAIDIVDALLIAQYYVGLAASLPGCATPVPTAVITQAPTVAPTNPPVAPYNTLVGFATLNGGTSGGQGGQTVTVSTYNDLKTNAESSTACIIMVQGTITNGSGGGQIKVKSNKSIIGVGSTAFLQGIGISIASANNIIIRNLRMTLVGTSTPGSVNGGDIVGISGTSRNIWIDHCELFSEDPDVQTDIDLYDGMIDIRDQTGFITVSWCYLHDHHKGGLVGAADDDLYADRKITFHHNYYNKVRLRIPMYRGSVGHFFNNYIVGAKDATEIRAGTCVRVEKNYYEALHYSIYTPSDSPGSTQRIDNIEVSRTDRAYPANCTADIPYDYGSVLTANTQDVKTIVPPNAGVGKI